MSFIKFLNESENYLSMISDELDLMDETEINEFGLFILIEFFDILEDDSEIEPVFTKEDVMDMISELGEDSYEYVYELLSDDDDEEDEEDDNLYEAVSQRVKNRNKKRIFQKKSKLDLRKTQTARKMQLRLTKEKRKRYYRANKVKLKKYSKHYHTLRKSNKHRAKIRRVSN